jgi:nicotinic acetylcholine receptor
MCRYRTADYCIRRIEHVSFFFFCFVLDFGPLTYGDDDLLPPDVSCALRSIQFIAKHTKDTDREIEVIEDWKFVAMVLDRFFLWIFIVACFVGTAAIILEAPSLYDETIPLDQLSHAYFPTATKLSM